MEKYIPFTQGNKNSAVAVYGTSVLDIESTLKNRVIPAFPILPEDNLDYRRRIHNSGVQLYYMLPILGNIYEFDRGLGRAIKGVYLGDHAYDDDFDKVNPVKALSFERQIDTARNYAFKSSLKRPFQSKYGQRAKVDWEDIVAFASTRFSPTEIDISDLLTEQKGFFPDYWENNPTGSPFLNSLPDEELVPLLDFAIQRRGVIVYCNSKLLDYDIRPGYEDCEEIMVTPKEPLPIDVILGISPISLNDIPRNIDRLHTTK